MTRTSVCICLCTKRESNASVKEALVPLKPSLAWSTPIGGRDSRPACHTTMVRMGRSVGYASLTLVVKEKPVWKFNLALKVSPCPNNLKGVTAECQLQLGNELCLAKTEYRTEKTLSRPSTWTVHFSLCTEYVRTKKGCRDHQQSNQLILSLIWLFRGRRSPFFVCTCSVHDEKCTVYVEGLEWGFFVRYSVFARQNSLPNWSWHSAVTPFKLLRQGLYFKANLKFQTGLSLMSGFVRLLIFINLIIIFSLLDRGPQIPDIDIWLGVRLGGRELEETLLPLVFHGLF
jgi:hypothetical protein